MRHNRSDEIMRLACKPSRRTVNGHTVANCGGYTWYFDKKGQVHQDRWDYVAWDGVAEALAALEEGAEIALQGVRFMATYKATDTRPEHRELQINIKQLTTLKRGKTAASADLPAACEPGWEPVDPNQTIKDQGAAIGQAVADIVEARLRTAVLAIAAELGADPARVKAAIEAADGKPKGKGRGKGKGRKPAEPESVPDPAVIDQAAQLAADLF